MRCFVTGGAGFLGSHLCERLLERGHQVTAYDNLSTGQRRFLEQALRHPGFRLVEGDLLESAALRSAMAAHDVVFHLAANADVRRGLERPHRDLEQNALGTLGVLEGMRETGLRAVVFASSSAVYGEPAVFPTPEEVAFPSQTSLYGASKLAAEGLIASYCAGLGFRGWCVRLVSLLGERYSHGHVADFYRKLRERPAVVEVLGDGRQSKAYLYVGDAVEAFLLGLEREGGGFTALNAGGDEPCTVDQSLGWICDLLEVHPQRRYSGGVRGWAGDSPRVHLDCSRLRALGWKPTLGVREGIARTVRSLQANPWLLERD